MTADPVCVCGHSRELHPAVREYSTCLNCRCPEYRSATTALLDRHHLRPGLMAELVEDVARLIERADASAAEQTAAAAGTRSASAEVAELERRIASLERAQEERASALRESLAEKRRLRDRFDEATSLALSRQRWIDDLEMKLRSAERRLASGEPLHSATASELLAELERRLNDGEAARYVVKENE